MAQIKWSERAMNEYRLCLQYSQEEFGTKAAKRFMLSKTRQFILMTFGIQEESQRNS